MRKFNEEIQKQYPNWFNGAARTQYPSAPPSRNAQRRTPVYVLPMLLTLGLMVGFSVAMHLGHKKDHIALSQNVSDIEAEVTKNRESLNLIAVLHNENFAAVRNACGMNDIIFINKDWTINETPKHLKLSPAEAKRFNEKYLTKPVKDAADKKAAEKPQS